MSAIASDTVILFSTSIFDYNYALFTDSLSTILGLLTLVIMLCCVCYQNFEDLSFSFFLFCITSLGILLNEAFVTKDLLVFFICFEGVIIPMFLIIKY